MFSKNGILCVNSCFACVYAGVVGGVGAFSMKSSHKERSLIVHGVAMLISETCKVFVILD